MFQEISRGYLPENYFSDKQVYKRRPPTLQLSQYPNKIEVNLNRDYAILVKKTGAKLQDAFAWMSTHPYIMVYNTAQANVDTGITANIAIEAYECPESRTYAMIAFRVAMTADETTNRIMQSKGESRRGPCPAPITGLLCRSGVNLQSVWQWLSLHRGRLAWLVDEPLISNTVAVIRRPGMQQYSTYDEFNTRRTRNLQQGNREQMSDVSLQQYLSRQLPVSRRRSRESLDSMLPVYEPPPPSIHHSIPEDIRAELEQMNNCSAQIGVIETDADARTTAALEEDEDEEEEEMAMVPVGRVVPSSMPPPYGEVAQETEYGRSFTTHLANAIFGSSSGFVIQNAAAAAAGLLVSSGNSISACMTGARETLPQTQTQTHTSASASPSSSTHSLSSSSSSSIHSNSSENCADNDGRILVERTGGSAMPVPFASTSRMPHAIKDEDALGNLQGAVLTRTFTQSMPALNRQLLSTEDAIAAVEESRRRALITAAMSNSSNSAAVAVTAASAARIAEQQQQRLCDTENVEPRETVTGISFPHDETAGGSSSSNTRSSRLLRSINVHVRRSRLSAKTNPEFGSGHKKSNWLTRLLNI
ncbi:hypothetical protein LPJ64_004391 [Coemansia asiatica]|uniref:Uncharacterized protein n=1 Tax=Coemansia asiatica TaxID=1052880 RepID=A0A9W7XJ86_9FUNG|nr:hypothetical protein LPJ64_004391 [Coemansia asiatica]